MSKTHYELRVNKHTIKISKKGYESFLKGSLRSLFTVVAVGVAAIIGGLASNINQGVYPKLLDNGETIPLSEAIFMLIFLSIALPVIFCYVAMWCNWGKKKEVK